MLCSEQRSIGFAGKTTVLARLFEAWVSIMVCETHSSIFTVLLNDLRSLHVFFFPFHVLHQMYCKWRRIYSICSAINHKGRTQNTVTHIHTADKISVADGKARHAVSHTPIQIHVQVFWKDFYDKIFCNNESKMHNFTCTWKITVFFNY